MKKGDRIEGVIERTDFPAKGMLRTDGGELVAVRGALPGQRVAAAVRKVRGGRAEGELLEVMERSPAEEAPFCPHSGFCGGCAYPSLPYAGQLALKEEQVMRLLAGVVPSEELSAAFLPAIPSPDRTGYRNKMEYTFGDEYKGGPLALGMHKKGGFYDIVNVPECQIAGTDFGAILSATRDYFAERGTAYYHRMRHEGYLRHLLVRRAAATGEILVDLVTSTQPCGAASEEGLLAGWRDAVLSMPLKGQVAGILHTKNDSLADAVVDGGTDVLWGRDYIFEELLGLRFLITPFSFFQTNSRGAEELYRLVRDFAGGEGESRAGEAAKGAGAAPPCGAAQDGGAAPCGATLDGGTTLDGAAGQGAEGRGAVPRRKVVYDLYSGTGTIAQMLAPAAGKVIGIELVPEAVLAARENARANGLANCEFLEGDVGAVLSSVAELPDLIVVDPPREGVRPRALEQILGYGVPQIVYISCKPTSLARDLAACQASGYRLERAACVDMFPWTANVECMALLSRVE